MTFDPRSIGNRFTFTHRPTAAVAIAWRCVGDVVRVPSNNNNNKPLLETKLTIATCYNDTPNRKQAAIQDSNV